MITDIRNGRFTVGASDLAITQRRRAALPPVVYLHGVGGTAAEPLTPAQSGAGAVLRALSVLGYPIAAPTIAAYWGNATGEARVGDAIAWARANLGAADAPAVLVGTSHGGGSALRYAAANPSLISCIVAMIPAVDYQALRVSNVLGLRASIDAAWGAAYPAALPAGANPSERTADLAGLPIQLWTASDDAVSENHAALTAAAGMNVTSYNVGALGHSNAAVAAVDEATVSSFVQAQS